VTWDKAGGVIIVVKRQFCAFVDSSVFTIYVAERVIVED